MSKGAKMEMSGAARRCGRVLGRERVRRGGRVRAQPARETGMHTGHTPGRTPVGHVRKHTLESVRRR